MVVIGSLRATSINRRLAQELIMRSPADIVMELFDRVGELPLYNEDLDHDNPAESVTSLRAAATRADALLVVTPEYNGTIPGGLKNVIDWLSRPYGRSPMRDKPAAVVGVSLGQYGGKWAHDDTRKSLSIAGPRVVDTVAVSIPVKSLNVTTPADHPTLMADLVQVLDDLAAAIGD
jgi:NAD(P)H-dependent FMN reductase